MTTSAIPGEPQGERLGGRQKTMQSILTKYIPATNTRGSRIKAICDRGSLTIAYPHELSGDAVHVAAAQALCEKFLAEDEKRGDAREGNVWGRPRVCGGLPSGSYAHAFSDWDNSVVVRFADGDDRANFRRYVERAKATDGTIGGLYAGLLCSALKRAHIG